MKIWRDDITKEKLKKDSVICASMSFLFMMGGVLIEKHPQMAVGVCIALAGIMFVMSVLLGIKARFQCKAKDLK